MKATEAVVLSALANLAKAKTRRFTELVRETPLDPAKDFRFADLSGVDLRGEDLRTFDLSHATFDGARTIGARFDPKRVSRGRLSRADASARALVVLVGEALLAEESYIDHELGLDIYLPRELNEAFRRSVEDSELRRRRTGIHFGDNSDLIRKRLNRAMQWAREGVHGPSITLVEPRSDFDFDALSATLATLQRQRGRPVVVLLPRLMSSEPSGEAIVRARTRALDSANTLSVAVPSSGSVRDASRMSAYAAADRAAALGFITALTSGRITHEQTFRPGYRQEVGGLALTHTSRRRRETIADALERLEEEHQSSSAFGWGARRRLILIREDALTADDPGRILPRLRRDATEVQVAAFPRQAKEQVEVYSLSGPRRGYIWSALPGRRRGG